MFPICKAPGTHSSISEEFLLSTFLRPKNPLVSWNLVNPLLRINKAWTDKCVAILQPLADTNTKPLQNKTFAIEKFRDSIIITRSCPGDKTSLDFKKEISNRKFC